MRQRRLSYSLKWTVLPIQLLIVAGCSGSSGGPASSPTPVPDSGLRGLARQGPINPVEQPGVPNKRPLPNALITVQTTGGREVARARTDGEGRFEIRLSPGAYRVVPLPPDPQNILPRAEPFAVTVRARQFTALVIDYDTGIR